jgi:hypothetical protein
MPRNDDWAQNVPYPVLADAPDIEIATKGIVNGLVPLTVMRFADANARAAALTGATAPVPGMITYLKAEDRWEARQGDGTWLLLSDGPWQPLTYASGYTAHSGSPGWRKKAGGGIELRGRIMRTGGGNFIADNTWRQFASIPAANAPGSPRYFVTAARHTVDSASQSHQTARIEVKTDGKLNFGIEIGGGTGVSGDPAWFCLDGVQFSPAGD